MGHKLGRRVYLLPEGERKLLTPRQHVTLAYIALHAWDTDGRYPAGYYLAGYRPIVEHGWGTTYTESTRPKCVRDVTALCLYGYLARAPHPDHVGRTPAFVIRIDALPDL